MREPLDPQALAEEMAAGNFDDERLTRRLATIVRCIATTPSASLPSVFTTAELEGTYRFFSNPRVEPEGILTPHIQATCGRAAEAKEVLIVHDTTDFTFRPDGARKGLGRSIKSSQTFFGHVSMVLAADTAHKPLGIAALSTWVRGPTRSGVENQRWLAQAQATQATFADSGAHIIHVMDREADDYTLFAKLKEQGCHFIVRSMFDRWTSNEDGLQEKLRHALVTAEFQIERKAELGRRRAKRDPVKAKIHPARAARTAKLSIATRTVSLVRPKTRGPNAALLQSCPRLLKVNVVRVWEPQPPDGADPVEWILLTDEPVDSPEAARAVVDHYRARWTIEEYFKALKTGCSYERRHFHDYESLVNVLATFAPIAYQALLLRTSARLQPSAPAAVVISDDELHVLRALGRRKLPALPCARDILLAVAALGGHIPYAPDPGWLTISRGLQKLDALTCGWRLAKLQPACDQR